MPNKNLTDQITRGESAFHKITEPEGKKKDMYRFSLTMPREYGNYLKTITYKVSEPGHIVSMNEYICNLIKKDMEAHNGEY